MGECIRSCFPIPQHCFFLYMERTSGLWEENFFEPSLPKP